MKKFKFLLVVLTLTFLCGCGKTKSSNVIEKFKDKTDRDTIDQIREKHESLKNITALYLET